MKWNWSNTGMLYIPYAPCMEYLPTIAKNAWQIQVNVPDYGLSSSKRNHHLFKWWLTSRDIVWLHNSKLYPKHHLFRFSNIYTFANCTTMTFSSTPTIRHQVGFKKISLKQSVRIQIIRVKFMKWNWSNTGMMYKYAPCMEYLPTVTTNACQIHVKYTILWFIIIQKKPPSFLNGGWLPGTSFDSHNSNFVQTPPVSVFPCEKLFYIFPAMISPFPTWRRKKNLLTCLYNCFYIPPVWPSHRSTGAHLEEAHASFEDQIHSSIDNRNLWTAKVGKGWRGNGGWKTGQTSLTGKTHIFLHVQGL